MTAPEEPGDAPREDDDAPEFDHTATLVFPRPKLDETADRDDEPPIAVEVVGGPMDGTRQLRKGSRLTIGRAAENDLALPMDPMISTRHARLVREGGTFFLEDLGSRNGTLLGDQPIEGRVPLGAGATFIVGLTRIELLNR